MIIFDDTKLIRQTLFILCIKVTYYNSSINIVNDDYFEVTDMFNKNIHFALFCQH